MGKSKNNKIIEIERWEQFSDKLEYEWAEKRGLSYPLGPLHRQQWEQEIFLQAQLEATVARFAEGNESSQPIEPEVHQVARYGPNWTSKQYQDFQVSWEDGRKYEDTIEEAALNGMNDSTFIDFRSYNQDICRCPLDRKEQTIYGRIFEFSSTAVSLSLSEKVTAHMYLRNTEVAYMKVYLDGGDNARGFMEFDGRTDSAIIELSDFSVVSELEGCGFTEDDKYLFTCFSKKHNIVFAQFLPTLKNVKLSFESERADLKIYEELKTFLSSCTEPLSKPQKKRGRPPKAKATAPEITSPAEPEEELVDSGEMDTTPTASDGAEGFDTQSNSDTDSLEEAEPDQAEPTPTTSGDGTEDSTN